MLRIIFIVIFPAKFINTDTKYNSSVVMVPKICDVRDKQVHMRFQVLFESVVSQQCCLFKALHGFFDFAIYISIFYFSLKVVFWKDVWRDIFGWCFHKRWLMHWRHKEKILRITVMNQAKRFVWEITLLNNI